MMLASTHENEEFQFLPTIKRLLLQVDGLKNHYSASSSRKIENNSINLSKIRNHNKTYK